VPCWRACARCVRRRLAGTTVTQRINKKILILLESALHQAVALIACCIFCGSQDHN
jgi:hypothetical protein